MGQDDRHLTERPLAAERAIEQFGQIAQGTNVRLAHGRHLDQFASHKLDATIAEEPDIDRPVIVVQRPVWCCRYVKRDWCRHRFTPARTLDEPRRDRRSHPRRPPVRHAPGRSAYDLFGTERHEVVTFAFDDRGEPSNGIRRHWFVLISSKPRRAGPCRSGQRVRMADAARNASGQHSKRTSQHILYWPR